MPRFSIFHLLLFALLAAHPVLGFSYCTDNRHPSVDEEILNSEAVVIGEVVKETPLLEDTSDPEGLTATTYQVHVLKGLRGHATDSIEIRSENTSSRFPMELSKRYVLFLQRDGQSYFIDNCGNSGLLSKSKKVMKAISNQANLSFKRDALKRAP
jgi:hypothetical protein